MADVPFATPRFHEVLEKQRAEGKRLPLQSDQPGQGAETGFVDGRPYGGRFDQLVALLGGTLDDGDRARPFTSESGLPVRAGVER